MPSIFAASRSNVSSESQNGMCDVIVAWQLCADFLLCCRHVKDPEVIVRALAGVWQPMDAALTAYSSDASATERLCRLPRYALRTSGSAAAPLLQPLLATLPARFEASGHSSYLYVASELVKLFGSDTAHDAGISALWGCQLPSSAAWFACSHIHHIFADTRMCSQCS